MIPADAASLCEQAGERYSSCVLQEIGLDLPVDPRALAACEEDPPTLALYRGCLPRATCAEFLGCVMDTVSAAVQVEAEALGVTLAQRPRAEQCDAYIADARRGVALQVAVANRTTERAAPARECLVGERPIETCLDPAELETLAGYVEQRRRDCEGWSDALAACVMALPGASGCDPDEHPLWVAPVALGDPGPPVAWSAEVQGGSEAERWLGPDGLVVVKEGYSGIRVLRGGETLWAASEGWYSPVLDGEVLLRKRPDAGLEVVDAATGRVRATVLEDAGIAGYAPGLVLTSDGALHRIDAARCRGKGRACVRQAVSVPEDAFGYEATVMGLAGLFLVGDTDGVVGFDASGKRRFSLDFDSAEFLAAVPPGRLAVATSGAVRIVDVAACEGEQELREATCVLTRGGTPGGDWMNPVPTADGAVFNDHGFMARTARVGDIAWTVNTGGRGRVAVDATRAYTLTWGPHGSGPVELLALDLVTGAALWHSPLPGAPVETDWYPEAGVVARDGWVVAQVATRIYALQVP